MKTILIVVASIFIMNPAKATETECMGIHSSELRYSGWIYSGGAAPTDEVVMEHESWNQNGISLGSRSRTYGGDISLLGIQGTFLRPEIIWDDTHARDNPEGWIIYGTNMAILNDQHFMMCVRRYPTIQLP